MRHTAIETTLRYYADIDADELAEELRLGYSSTSPIYNGNNKRCFHRYSKKNRWPNQIFFGNADEKRYAICNPFGSDSPKISPCSSLSRLPAVRISSTKWLGDCSTVSQSTASRRSFSGKSR